MELAVIGGSAFTLGFALSGIKRIIEADVNPAVAFKQTMQEGNVGIIITDEATMSKLDEHVRDDIEHSVKPVVVVLSAEATQEGLRKMIKKSIGVDLLKE
ncbi:V-type ATP synthase subunit F [Candidatus Woesearchaeota archaeon]|nr:V-type ATP synthase subunit F [Candidatus Woesearchaeota archaeon]